MGLASRRGQRTAGTVACRHRSRRKHPVGNAASRVERSLTITALARRTGDTLWLPSLSPNTGCAAELPANVFTGDSRWHLVTGAFGGLGRLAVNWLREKGARRIALLAPRVDESWLRDVEGGQTRVCRCDVGDAGNWPRFLTIWRPTAALPERFMPLAYWLTRPCRSLMTTSWLPFSR